MGYIANFIVYTLAMVGVMVTALIVFKNTMNIGGRKSSKHLKIIDSISLGQRKNLYVISTGTEQFLIASDVNNTSLISKLERNINENGNNIHKNYDLTEELKPATRTFEETLASLPKQNFMDKSNIGIRSSIMSDKRNTNKSVMKNIAELLK